MALIKKDNLQSTNRLVSHLIEMLSFKENTPSPPFNVTYYLLFTEVRSPPPSEPLLVGQYNLIFYRLLNLSLINDCGFILPISLIV